MKRLLLFALLCGALAGCGKNTTESEPASEHSRKVRQVRLSDGSYTCAFVYSGNRLAGWNTTRIINGTTQVSTCSLTYSGNEIAEYRAGEYIRTYRLDAGGRITALIPDVNKLRPESGRLGDPLPTVAEATRTLTYGNSRLTSVRNGTGHYKAEYAWENGNLKAITETSYGGAKKEYVFEYGSTANVLCGMDVFKIAIWEAGAVLDMNVSPVAFMTGTAGLGSKSFPNRMDINGELIYLDYETDADGYVTGFRVTDKTKNTKRYNIICK